MSKSAEDPKAALKHQENGICALTNFLTSKRMLISIFLPKVISLFKIRKDSAKVLLEVKDLKQLKRQWSKEELLEKRRKHQAEQELLRKTVDTSHHFSRASSETFSLKTKLLGY